MMLLEKRYTVMPADTELSELEFENIDGMSLPIVSILTTTDTEGHNTFAPKLLTQFPRSVTLSPQYAKGRHLMTAYCTKNSTYQVRFLE